MNNKNIEEQIKEILSVYAKMLWEAMQDVTYKQKLTSDSPIYEIKGADDIVEVLTNLIQQEKESAVREFATHLAHTIRPREEVFPETFITEVEQYLSQQERGKNE